MQINSTTNVNTLYDTVNNSASLRSTDATNTTGNATTNGTQTTTSSSSVLSQQDFFTLLVAELTNQDPLNPQTNSEFASQVAQYSTLDATTSMQSDIAALRTEEKTAYANSLLGRTVQVSTGTDTTSQGTVSSVQTLEGTPYLIVNGQAFTLSQVVAVQAEAETSATR